MTAFRFRLLGFFIWLLACGPVLAAKNIWVVLGAETPTHQETAQALRQQVDKRAGVELDWSVGVWESMPTNASFAANEEPE